MWTFSSTIFYGGTNLDSSVENWYDPGNKIDIPKFYLIRAQIFYEQVVNETMIS